MKSFQSDVGVWLEMCFGESVAHDKLERNHRFIEEALELVQAAGMTKQEVLQLVDYTFARPKGELEQEIGGVMVTLAALCFANDVSLATASHHELARIWTKIDVIREKQKNKPKHGSLPQ